MCFYGGSTGSCLRGLGGALYAVHAVHLAAGRVAAGTLLDEEPPAADTLAKPVQHRHGLFPRNARVYRWRSATLPRTCGWLHTCHRLAVLEPRGARHRNVLAALDNVRLDHDTHDHGRGIARLQLLGLNRSDQLSVHASVRARAQQHTMFSATSICFACCFELLPWLQSICPDISWYPRGTICQIRWRTMIFWAKPAFDSFSPHTRTNSAA